jgi:hypothetical protein
MRLLVLLTIAVLLSTPAHAAPITVYYRGTIGTQMVQTSDPDFIAGANKEFPVGAIVEWLWTFDPDYAWPDPFIPAQGFSLANAGDAYNWTASVAGHRFDARTVSYVLGTWRGDIFHVDGSTGLNNFYDDNLTFNGFDWLPYVHTLDFAFPPGDDPMTGTVGNWSTWLSTQPDGQGIQIRMRGQFTYAERVPSPSSLIVMLSGIAVAAPYLGASRWSRRLRRHRE